MKETSSKRFFYIGFVVFFSIKLLYVLIITSVISSPRLGDDSLVYLWKGALSSLKYNNQLPALKDIRDQHNLTDNPTAELKTLRSRVAIRTIGTITPIYDVLTAILLSLGLSLKWTFALTEIMGIIALSIGCALFLNILIGPAAAGIGLILLSFAILPYQGINVFIPGNFALSISMCLWAYLIKTKSQAQILPVFVTALFVLGVHPIAKVYVLMAITLHIISIGNLSSLFNRHSLLLYGSIIIALIIAMIVPHIIPALAPPPSGDLGQVSFGQHILGNIKSAGALIKDPLIRKNSLLAGLFVGSLFIFRKEIYNFRICMTLVLIVALMSVSMIHNLPGYPGELFSRLLVPFAVVAAGVAGKSLLLLLQPTKYRKIKVTAIATWFCIILFFWGGDYFLQQLNARKEIIFDQPLTNQLERFPKNITLLYLETDITLQTALLHGGYNYRTLAYTMLANSKSFDTLMNKQKPSVAVLPNISNLNTLSSLKVKNFEQRKHGFYFPVNGRITLSKTGDSFSNLYLFINNQSGSFKLLIDSGTLNIREKSSVIGFDVPSGYKGWLNVWDDRLKGSKVITILLPQQKGWIEGIATAMPEQYIRWPWKSEMTISYFGYGRSKKKINKIKFSVKELLAEYNAKEIEDIIDKESPVISDESGLVFLKTIL